MPRRRALLSPTIAWRPLCFLTSYVRTGALLVLPWFLTACAIPLQTRTGEVLPPGRMRLGGFVGGSFGPSKLPDAIPLELVANEALTARLGLLPRVETMVDLSFLRQSLGFRCDLFNAGRGEAVSLALVAAASAKPILVRDESASYEAYEWSTGWDATGGIDFSLPLGRSVEPLLNLTWSWGDQWYHVPKADQESLHIEESRYRMAARTEGRIETTVGLAILLSSDRNLPRLVVGVTPYWVTASPAVPGNNDSRPDGVTFTLGAEALIHLWDRTPTPPERSR